MTPSERDRLIEAMVERYRAVLEQRVPQGPQTLDEIEQTVEEVSVEMERELERRILEQQEREQALRLRFVRHQVRKQPGQANCLSTQVHARQRVPGRRHVALGENEIDDRQYRIEAVWQVFRLGDCVRYARVAEPLFGADDALRHRRFRHEEGTRDLGGVEPAERAQRQCDARFHRQCRMAAGEDQPEPIVANR